MTGRSLPSTSMVISLVTRIPPSLVSSALTSRWWSLVRAPAGTGEMKRILLEP